MIFETNEADRAGRKLNNKKKGSVCQYISSPDDCEENVQFEQQKQIFLLSIHQPFRQ